MNYLLINEDRTIWLGVIGSLLIHGLLFAFSGTTFIQHAQYSVQPSAQMVEVSIEEIKDSSVVSRVIANEAKPRQGGAAQPAVAHHGTTLSPNEAIGHIDIRSKKVFHSKSGVKVKANPDYFQNPPPEYPELAKQMRQEGIVMLSADVDRIGEPIKVKIIQSSGYRLLDQAALKAVSHWKFQPGSVGNIAIESTVTVPVRFRLEK